LVDYISPVCDRLLETPDRLPEAFDRTYLVPTGLV
jgi:hypothetical protein